MANKKVTRRALTMSIVSLILCCAMLVGTTFAWFTDSESSAVNTIQSGTLKVDLVYANDEDTSAANKTLKFVKAAGAPADEAVLWEPGCTYELESVKVVNNGNLALKYQVSITGINGSDKLLEVIKFKISDTSKGNLGANEKSDAITITAHMDENAGNEYQGLTLTGVGITVTATQDTVEFDSFGKDYDANAQMPAGGGAGLPGDDFVGVEFPINDADGNKIGTALVPEDAMDAEKSPKIIVTDSDYKGNFSIGSNQETKVYNIEVEGLKENNNVPIKVQLQIGAGMDPSTVAVYHVNDLIDSAYNPQSGYVSFASATFSPFTVVYDAESEYVPPVVDGTEQPKASVVESPEYVNAEQAWGSYGPWSPTPGLDHNLESVYTFSCTETYEEAKQNPYANWHCDFYVKLDRDLGANQLFLGGNYGTFGWVGFHNGNFLLPAGQEIGLLTAHTTNAWTYLDVAKDVRTFICGVGDVDDALKGATFTVMLRLTNPENPAEFYNVATINYTFE